MKALLMTMAGLVAAVIFSSCGPMSGGGGGDPLDMSGPSTSGNGGNQSGGIRQMDF